jgi:pyruvate kinase
MRLRARACKIVATLGPASDGPGALLSLANAGADCFRFNMSHGDRAGHQRRHDAVRALEQRLGRPFCVLADLQGPKLRVGAIAGGAMLLKAGEAVEIEASDAPGAAGLIRLPHPEIIGALAPGDALKLDDGKIELAIEARRGPDRVAACVVIGGVLSDHKGVNVPGRKLPIAALTEKDRADLAFALDLGADYICLSFVQAAEDVRALRDLVGDRAGILAKIEKPAALDALEEIVALSDAVMVARGDLGVELPLEQVPIAQRRIIRAARAAGKPAIVATQMLESMIDASSPTRAEASDVANAVYQGVDAVMLSAESAVGRHPATAVAVMERIIRAVEADPEHWSGLARETARPEPTTADAVSLSAREIADVLGCASIVGYTSTGSTALRLARERPRCGVIGLTPSPGTARRLSLAWGVRSVVTADATNVEDMIEKAETVARAQGAAASGDRIVVTAGIPFGRPGKTNTIRIARLD